MKYLISSWPEHTLAGCMAPRVLVIDDDPSVRTALEEVFREAGIETCAVENGAEAIDQLSEGNFSAILLDLKMPVVSGFGVLDFIRKHRPDLLSRVLIVSGLPLETIEEHAFDLRDRLFLKPFLPADLLRLVEGYVALHST